MKQHFIDELFTLAQAVEPVRGARIAAGIVHRGKIVGYGYCHKKSHPFQAKFAKNEHAVFFHAETHAIKNALNNISVSDLKKSSLYIARARYKNTKAREWEYGLACPCAGCQSCIETFEIQNIFYTLNRKGIASH